MRTVALPTLISKVRTRSDTELSPSGDNNTVITDSQIKEFLNDAIFCLHDIIVSEDEKHFISSSVLTSTGSAEINLPSDFYRLISVEQVHSSTDSTTLRPLEFNNRNKYNNPLCTPHYKYNKNYQYYLSGSMQRKLPTTTQNVPTITIKPAPASGEQFRVYYTADASIIGDLSDGYVDHVNVQGVWEEYVVTHAAIKVAEKEESDTVVTFLSTHLVDLEARVLKAIRKRNIGMPHVMTDVFAINEDYWW